MNELVRENQTHFGVHTRMVVVPMLTGYSEAVTVFNIPDGKVTTTTSEQSRICGMATISG